MPLQGTETLLYETASGSVITPGTTTPLAVALLAAANPARAVNAVSSGSGATLTAAALVAGVVNRTGPSNAFTDTTDTAANIIAALPANTPQSTTWLFFLRNLTPFAETVASGSGVTLTGNMVVPANSVFIGMFSYTGSATVGLVGLATVPIDMGVLEANTAISTVGAGTLTAAGIAGGVVTRSGSTAAYTDTTDTAVNIIAALPNSAVGQAWEFSLINTVAYPETVAAGSGVTLSGLSPLLPGNSTGRFLVTYSGAAAVAMQLIAITADLAGLASAVTALGAGSGTFPASGLVNRQVSAAGVNPGGTGADNVLAAYTLPANSFDAAGRRIEIIARGSFAGNTNAKRLKLIFNPSTAVVGSTVGSGGTTIADTGSQTTNANGVGWEITGAVQKYGSGGSNTQLATAGGVSPGAPIAPTTPTATESGAILIAVTGNATTTATDIVFNELVVVAQD